MKIYEYKNISKCFIGGNADINLEETFKTINCGLSNKKEEKIHPKEEERIKRLAKRNNSSVFSLENHTYSLRGINSLSKKQQSQKSFDYDNSVIIFTGGCGLGTKNDSYFNELFDEYNDVFAANNCHVLFVRGCNDDPSYFENELINLSNIKAIKDYSLIQFSEFNCLCIGGGISADRSWKINSEKNTGKKTYWENEDLVFNEKEVNEIFSNFDVACVITNEIPTFVPPSTGFYKHNKWYKSDEKLIKDTINSRIKLDNVYNIMLSNGKKPYVWWFTHNTMTNNESLVNDICFSSRFNNIESLNMLVMSKFNIFLTKEDKKGISKKIRKEKKKLAEDFGDTLTYNETIYNQIGRNVPRINEALDAGPFPVNDYNEAIRAIDENQQRIMHEAPAAAYAVVDNYIHNFDY